MKTAPEGAGVLNHCVECQIKFDRFAITTAAAFSAAVLSSRSLKGSKPAGRLVVSEIAASAGFSALRWASTRIGDPDDDINCVGGVGLRFDLGGCGFHAHGSLSV